MRPCCSEGHWDAEGGSAKSTAEAGHNIATAFDLCTHLKQHHSAPTNYYHKSLHQKTSVNFTSSQEKLSLTTTFVSLKLLMGQTVLLLGS